MTVEATREHAGTQATDANGLSSERAVAILADARRMARKESTAASFVFFGVIPKRPLSNMALSMLCAG